MSINEFFIEYLPVIILALPIFGGAVSFCLKNTAARSWALFSAVVTLFATFYMLYLCADAKSAEKIARGSYTLLLMDKTQLWLGLDGLGLTMVLLNALSFPLIFIATYNTNYKNAKNFYGLMLLAQAGLMGVFIMQDALFFYFFWELALIPVYFLCSNWGGEARIAATFKFFIYTFLGSLLMLVGIIFLYQNTQLAGANQHGFSLVAFENVNKYITQNQQKTVFWLFFIAFAIKMPIFPLHTWQPQAYSQAPTATTMVMSGVMVKMGLYACLRWLIPIFPAAVQSFNGVIIALCIIGIIYGSIIAIKQDDIKKLIAYSSIAHIGLMAAGIFTLNQVALQGATLQMFFHGVNIIGMWMVVLLLERKTGISKISQLGGAAQQAPTLTIFLVIIALANIALPLTNAFIGEFMLFTGLYAYNPWLAAIAGISIILAAVYTLNMVQKVFYGNTNTITNTITDINLHEKIALTIVVVLIFMMGLYPQPMIDLTKKIIDNLQLVLTIKPHVAN
jgi:NADH-quinone oxidoreductase subunit M